MGGLKEKYLVPYRMESTITELVEVLVHVGVWQIAAYEGAVDDSVWTSQIRECASSFELSEIVKKT